MTVTSVTADWLFSTCSAADERTDIERAFARHAVGLHRYLAVRAGDAHEADDLMQQLWLRARKGAAGVPANELEFWLKAVAKNLLRGHWRRQARTPREVPIANPSLAEELADRIAEEDLPESLWERREVRDQLILAVTDLTSTEQEVIVGYYFQGETHSGLAARLGISERAVEGRLYRARMALRRKLKSLDCEGSTDA